MRKERFLPAALGLAAAWFAHATPAAAQVQTPAPTPVGAPELGPDVSEREIRSAPRPKRFSAGAGVGYALTGNSTLVAGVLDQSMVRQGMKNVAAGANPMALKRGV